MYKILRYIFVLSGLFALRTACAQTSSDKIDVREVVLGHIGDAYEWCIAGSAVIPLPVIVRDAQGGWLAFSSARLRDGAVYKGFQIATDGDCVGRIVDAQGNRPLDLSLTKNAAAMLLNSLLTVSVILAAAKWYRRRRCTTAPGGFPGAVEAIVMTVYDDVICGCAGSRARRFAPYLLTLFFFVLVNNLMGLLPVFPGGANVTGSLSVTLVLAVMTFLAVNLFGSRRYWREIFWPDVPTWLKLPVPLMPLVEIFGIFTKPFALMIRLAANMIAGHTVILALTCLIFLTAELGLAVNGSMSVAAVVLGVFMNLIELLVAFVQAYVFTLLTAVFIGLSGPEQTKQDSLKS